MIWKTKYRVIFGIAVGVLVILAVMRVSTTESALFRRLVTFRIPPSVTHIEADSYRTFGEHYYVLRFNISRQNLVAIADAQRFTRLRHADYLGSHISYSVDPDYEYMVLLYGPRRAEPPWFDLKQWKNPTAYLVEREVENCWYKARLLLYNEECGAAYFIEYEMRGHWGGGLAGVTTRKGAIPGTP